MKKTVRSLFGRFKNQPESVSGTDKTAVYGQEEDYFDDPNCIAWTCLGDDEHPTALAILISNANATSKRLFVGEKWANHIFTDARK